VDITVNVNIEDVVEKLCIDRQQALEWILHIDAAVTDWSFTENLVIMLLESMKYDVYDEEPINKAIELIKSCGL